MPNAIDAFLDVIDDVLEAEMPSWKKPWKRVVAWYVTHDAFHGAQIRSMGLPSLREKRHD